MDFNKAIVKVLLWSALGSFHLLSDIMSATANKNALLYYRKLGYNGKQEGESIHSNHHSTICIRTADNFYPTCKIIYFLSFVVTIFPDM